MKLIEHCLVGTLLLTGACTSDVPPATQKPTAAEQPAGAGVTPDAVARGPRGGWLLRSGDLAIELQIFEAGIPPEFHAHGYLNEQPLAPDQLEIEVSLGRLGGEVDRFAFRPAAGFLRGDGVVGEPHSFDVIVKARHGESDHQWEFAAYEGRAEIPEERAEQLGLVTAEVGPAKVREEVAAGGVVRSDGGLHVELDVYEKDRSRVAAGQVVELEAPARNLRASGTVRSLTRRVVNGEPAVRARVDIEESGESWQPGQFVRARIITASHSVPLAVRTSALQSFRDSDVVFARVGDTYEVRMLELGRIDREWSEVLSGIPSGETYVSDNAMMIRAELKEGEEGHGH